MKKFSVKQLCICAAMIALHIVLEFVSIRIGNDYKITLSVLPVVITAILYGPFSGFLVGLLGSVISQLLTYGITATTIYWIWPPAIHGLAVGFLFRIFGRKLTFHFEDKKALSAVINPVTICVFAGGLINTICNYIATLLDSKVWGYYSEIYMIGLIPIRLVNWILTSAVCSIITLILIRVLEKTLSPDFDKKSDSPQ